MVVLACTALGLTAIVVAGLLLPAARHKRYFGVLCMALVYVSALPLLASLIQFTAIGLNRFYIGYQRLQPFYPRVAVVVPAWNEAHVIGATIERLLTMDYPDANVRVYVVDDASTDTTPEVVRAWAAREPDRVYHLRRERGGQGKAHTLNHGIAEILTEPWAQALLIIDADVLFDPTALRRMARHLSNPDVGSVTAYIKEGTAEGNYLTRYIAYEYITAQAAARRAQNVFGAMVCLAGGAQLHSRQNLMAIGGLIDTSTLAEDTVTTFRTQLSGNRVVFEGNAIVWAEEPGDLDGLWKQRLRWARGNVQISLQFAHIWLRGRRYGKLGGASAGLDLVHRRVDAALHDGRVDRPGRPLPAGCADRVDHVPPAVDLSRDLLHPLDGDVVRARPSHRPARVAGGPVLSRRHLARDHHLQRRGRAVRHAC